MMHRAGLESAMVADLGVAETERIAVVIKKAWPKPKCGRALSGSSLDERFKAVVFRPDEATFAFYAVVYVYGVLENPIGTGGYAVAIGKPVAPFGLAMVRGHDGPLVRFFVLGSLAEMDACVDAVE